MHKARNPAASDGCGCIQKVAQRQLAAAQWPSVGLAHATWGCIATCVVLLLLFYCTLSGTDKHTPGLLCIHTSFITQISTSVKPVNRRQCCRALCPQNRILSCTSHACMAQRKTRCTPTTSGCRPALLPVQANSVGSCNADVSHIHDFSAFAHLALYPHTTDGLPDCGIVAGTSINAGVDLGRISANITDMIIGTRCDATHAVGGECWHGL